MNQNKFIEEVKKLGLTITEFQLNQLDKYYNILIKYNKVMNLTGITEKEQVYLKHFYDSLTISKIIDLNSINNLCDLGSGAGFPGIVLKIFYPNLKITLIDSLNKRVKFLNEVIKELNLENIVAIHSRIEDYAKTKYEQFDVVTARAVSSINILLELGINLVKVNKYFVFMKGNMEKEPDYINALNKLSCRQIDLIKFKLPIENSDRCLVKIEKLKNINKYYPRKYKDIISKPL